MKKVFRTIALALVMAMMLGITAFAAPEVKPEAGKTVVADINSEKITSLTYTDGDIAKDGQYMIFVVKPESGAYVPTASSILYINQKQAEGNGAITFENIFPKSMMSSGIMISGTGLSAPELIAKILAALLGDITKNGEIDVADAMLLLQYVAGLAEMDTEQIQIGNVTGGDLDVADAMLLLQYVAGLASLN